MQAVWAYSALVFCLAQCVHPGHADDEIPKQELEKWTDLTHNMVHLFYRQRNEGNSQFAFVVVGELQDRKKAPESIVLERWNDNFHKGTTKYIISNKLDQTLLQTAARDPNDESDMLYFKEPISPKLRNLYVNYVAASVMKSEDKTIKTTVTKKQHTEHTLLAELDDLYTAYKQSKGGEPNFLLLYTWFFPCADPNYDNGKNTMKGGCTTKILNKRKQQHFDKMTWIVGYTAGGFNSMPYITRTGNKINEQSMTSQGISVIQVECDGNRHLHQKGNNGINIQSTSQGPNADARRKIS